MKRVTHPDVLSSDGLTKDIAVGTDETVYTKAFKLAYGEYFSLFYKATSAGVVDIKIEIEQCWELPTTEGSQDNDYVEPEGLSDVDDVADTTQHCKSISPIPSEYARLKLTGGATNDANNTIRIRLGKQEDY